MGNRWSTSDQLAVALFCLASVVAIVVFWIEKTPLWAGVSIVVLALLLIYPILHFASSLTARILICALAICGLGLFGRVIWPRTAVVSATAMPTVKQAPTATTPVQPKSREGTLTGAKAHPRSRSIRPTGSVKGSDNTLFGDTGNRTVNGNGNTIIGATDSNGNTVLNHGGVAIGKGASADPTSIAIGAGAHAGNTLPTVQNK
jgi:hypothetical protein